MKTYSWLTAFSLALCVFVSSPVLAGEIQWINHLGFLPGNAVVNASFDGTNGLKLSSTAAGEYAVAQGLQLPPGFLVKGVRICYDLTDVGSYITEVRINQAGFLTPILYESDDLISTDPVCENVSLPAVAIDTNAGPLTLVLKLHFGSTPQNMFVTGVGLLVAPDPDAPMPGWLNHTHEYLTGKGVGHNKVVATTGGPINQGEEPDPVIPPKNNGNNKNK